MSELVVEKRSVVARMMDVTVTLEPISICYHEHRAALTSLP